LIEVTYRLINIGGSREEGGDICEVELDSGDSDGSSSIVSVSVV